MTPDSKISRNYVGPPCDAGSRCSCGIGAVAKCEGCGENLCTRCWWRHSHNVSTLEMRAFMERQYER